MPMQTPTEKLAAEINAERSIGGSTMALRPYYQSGEQP